MCQGRWWCIYCNGLNAHSTLVLADNYPCKNHSITIFGAKEGLAKDSRMRGQDNAWQTPHVGRGEEQHWAPPLLGVCQGQWPPALLRSHRVIGPPPLLGSVRVSGPPPFSGLTGLVGSPPFSGSLRVSGFPALLETSWGQWTPLPSRGLSELVRVIVFSPPRSYSSSERFRTQAKN